MRLRRRPGEADPAWEEPLSEEGVAEKPNAARGLLSRPDAAAVPGRTFDRAAPSAGSRSSAAAAPRSRACAGIAAVPSLPTSRPYLIKKGEEGARGPLCRAEAGGQGRADLPGNRGGGRAPAGRGGAGRAGAAVGARTRRRWGRCGRPGGLSRGGAGPREAGRLRAVGLYLCAAGRSERRCERASEGRALLRGRVWAAGGCLRLLGRGRAAPRCF